MSSTISSDAFKLYQDTRNQVKSFLRLDGDKSPIYFTLSLLIVAFFIFLVISWVFHTLSKKDAACKKLNTIYLDNSKHKTNSFFTNHGDTKTKQYSSPQNFFDNPNKSLIKNYYIKTAYNACCGDGYKNNFVNICALEKCIQVGARCLDFEIYSYNGEPIVAASTANNNSIKETYNYIKLTELFDILSNRSFDETYTDCAYDPMFLHFRIMSENKVIYDKFGDYIEKHLKNNKDNLVDINKYNYKFTDHNVFLQEHLGKKHFSQRFIIMVHTLHVPILDNSKLAKYVHIRSGSNALKLLRYEQVVAAGRNNPMMIDDSHRNLIIVLPNLDNSLENFDPLLPLNNGCQFVGMKFQNIDNNLVGYFKMFTDKGKHSFVLKPNDLRKDIIPAEPIPEDAPLNRQTLHTLQTSDGT
jgi:hypothetical protein|tara:strand:+ start:62 stop:1297 length:1236 start_codon:yes stop_codon:yes gene_type:complete